MSTDSDRQRLRDLPDSELPEALEELGAAAWRAFGGHVCISLSADEWTEPEVLARVPALARLDFAAPEVPAWVGRHGSTLRALRVTRLERFGDPDTEPWRELRDRLTALHLIEARLSDEGWEELTRFAESATRLASLTLGAADGSPGLTADQFDRLARLDRVCRLRRGERPFGGDKRPSPTLAGEQVSVGGVSLRLPPGWVRLAPTSGGDVEILGEWVEWGDGDPADRLDTYGPVWLVLERLNFPVRAADAAHLLALPGSLAEPFEWEGVGLWETPRGPARHAAGACSFARHQRWLWPGQRDGLRLRLEVPCDRMMECDRVGEDIVSSVEI